MLKSICESVSSVVDSHGIKNQSSDQFALWAIILLLFFSLLFLPPLTWLLAIGALALTSNFADRTFRLAAGLSLVFTWSVIVASRSVLLSPSDDFTNYYAIYQDLANGNINAIFTYGQGLEFGFPLILYVISIISNDLSPNSLIFIVVLISAFIFLIWLEFWGLRAVPIKLKGLATAFTWCLCSFFMASQLTRQFLSSLLLLYALFSNGLLRRYILLIIAASFHLTSIPIYFIIVSTTKYKWKAVLFVCLIFFLFTQYLQTILNNDLLLAISGFDKLGFWTGNDDNSLSGHLAVLRWFSLPLFFILINMMKSNNKLDAIPEWGYIYIYIYYIIYIMLIPYPLMSMRFTFILNTILLGWLLFYFGKSRPRLLLCLLFLFFLPLRLKLILITDPADLMAYWTKYDYGSFFPGYYLFN